MSDLRTQRAALDVRLDIYEGPLDLLLYLIRKSDLDIHDIPIAQITKEYLGFLDLMKELNLEIAGEFLVMATTLMQVKARMLLPQQKTADGELVEDPRDELVQRLMEYQRFKEASNHLKEMADEASRTYFRGEPTFEAGEKILRVEVFDILAVMQEVLSRTEDTHVEIQGEQFPVEEKIRKIETLLEGRDYVTLREVFEGERRRLAIVTCFLALLELIKINKIFARQDENMGEIRIFKKEEPADDAPVEDVSETQRPGAAEVSEENA